jgi:hypothetical protein
MFSHFEHGGFAAFQEALEAQQVLPLPELFLFNFAKFNFKAKKIKSTTASIEQLETRSPAITPIVPNSDTGELRLHSLLPQPLL